MEGLSLDNIMTGEEAAALFDPETKQEETEETSSENSDENKKESKETTEVVDVDTLFTDKPESVGSEDHKGKEDTPSKEETSPNFYSSIAKTFAEDGVFQDLNDEAISKVKDAESFMDLVEEQIQSKLDERQKRIDQALNAGIEPTQVQRFENNIKMEQFTKEDREVYNKMSEHWRTESPIMRWYVTEENKELRKKFNQILKTSAKGFDWCLYNSLDAWYTSFIRGSLGKDAFGENWVKHLDGNRDFRHNIKAFEYARDKERNDKIIENEAKIKAIEQLSNEEFVIIVPSDIEQFTQEGQMQNNCVGYYYHNNMAMGRDLIYFIRHTATPRRSYITNRYNVHDRQTVESRIKNNENNNDSKARELIKRIDEKIRELFSAE